MDLSRRAANLRGQRGQHSNYWRQGMPLPGSLEIGDRHRHHRENEQRLGVGQRRMKPGSSVGFESDKRKRTRVLRRRS